MSENAIVVLALDVQPDVSEMRSKAVAGWLLSKGIVVPNSRRDRLRQPSEFLPGPQADRAAPNVGDFLRLLNNGVDVISQRQLYQPFENYEPPICPACGTPIDPDVHLSLVDEWMVAEEPTVTCPNCGASHPVGDWSSGFTFYVSNVAVRFNNWITLADEFTSELGVRLGSRWRVMYQYS